MNFPINLISNKYKIIKVLNIKTQTNLFISQNKKESVFNKMLIKLTDSKIKIQSPLKLKDLLDPCVEQERKTNKTNKKTIKKQLKLNKSKNHQQAN